MESFVSACKFTYPEGTKQALTDIFLFRKQG